ncbi:hypothetical protein [Amycolatopsis magusensis]|uniref:hypothetical protein n=1 Tax=Amycolatopsis magusensis TaxID=882444 RepID=UPI003C2CA9D0
MSTNSRTVARFVTVTMGLVIGLTFLFGFGNVLNLALKLGVPVYVAPLVAPAVDLTVLGLLVGTRHLALSGAGDDVLRPARRLLLAASVVTLLLNVADPVAAGHWGKAAFDAVGPLLLIGWAEAGPGLLRALSDAPQPLVHQIEEEPAGDVVVQSVEPTGASRSRTSELDGALLELARRADAEHWRRCRRPISAETLRKELRVGAATSRELVAVVRAMNGPAAS